ncbi:MAG: CAP domain-containing protein [Chromatiales bacterium]|nr:CAP domain-containing protein [Chromatiales bacterium]
MSALTPDSRLQAAAQAHADWMAQASAVSHTGEGGSAWTDRANAAGYAGSYVGENIAAGPMTAEQVMTAWMASPAHHANIVRAAYRDIGVGIVSGDQYQTIFCVLFGVGG